MIAFRDPNFPCPFLANSLYLFLYAQCLQEKKDMLRLAGATLVEVRIFHLLDDLKFW